MGSSGAGRRTTLTFKPWAREVCRRGCEDIHRAEIGLDASRFLRAQGVYVAERDVDDFLVEKQQGREGLSLGGGGDLLLGSQVAQKLLDFCYAHRGGAAEFVEADVFLVPRDVGCLGADGVSAPAVG